MKEWHAWTGGDCPVHHGAVVEVQFRGCEPATVPAGRLRWDRRGTPTDIMSYRVVPEPALISGSEAVQDPPPDCPSSVEERAARAFAAIVGSGLPPWQVRLLAELLKLAEEAQKNG